jgi:adenine deaminase
LPEDVHSLILVRDYGPEIRYQRTCCVVSKDLSDACRRIRGIRFLTPSCLFNMFSQPMTRQKEQRKINRPAQETELLLEGGRVLNVYSGEILEYNVAVKGEKIWYVGPGSDPIGEKPLRLDVSHKVLVPGYIEPHCHPWNVYNPISVGQEFCRLGTTTLVCDNLIFFMMMGVERFEAFMDAMSKMPVKFFWFVRLVPQTPLGREEALFSASNLERLLRNPLTLSIGEITRWQELIKGNPKIQKMICLARSLGKPVDGHTAGAKYENLSIISRAGVASCHESITAEEVLERVRLGFYVILRESSLRQDLRALLQGVRKNPLSLRRVMLTTDGSSPAFLLQSGMTDHLVRMAIEEGIDPVEAYRMVTLNPAAYFGLEDRLGGIAPGRDADILVLNDLHDPVPELVISKGRIVAEKGALRALFPEPDWKRFTISSGEENRLRVTREHFEIPFKGKLKKQSVAFPVIKLVSTVITRIKWMEFPVRDGVIDLSAVDGVCRVAALDRRGRWIANGALEGYADRIEGIASTFNTALQILVIGRNPDAMTSAVNRVVRMGGGIAAIEGGNVIFEFPLPIGGMMSEEPLKELAAKETALKELLSSRGYPFHDPLYTFIFLPNDFLPEVRINRKGVVDIKKNEVLWPARRLPIQIMKQVITQA